MSSSATTSERVAESVRGRWHPDLHPVLRVLKPGPFCQSAGPIWIDDDGEEATWGCHRPAGHTGRHFDWEWDGATQKIHVWTDEEATHDGD